MTKLKKKRLAAEGVPVPTTTRGMRRAPKKCPHDGTDIYVDRDGRKHCQACRRERGRERRLRVKNEPGRLAEKRAYEQAWRNIHPEYRERHAQQTRDRRAAQRVASQQPAA